MLVLHNASSIKYKKKIKPLPKKNFKIGFFGTIYDSRGLDLFIKLSKKDKFNDYYIYGGSKKEIYKLKRENFNSNLHLNEYVSQKKFILELEKIDICLLPYTKKITVAGDVGDISKYTSPLKVFDYMKLGKLIISSDIEVLREILNKKNSVLVKNYMNMLSWLNVLKKVKKNRIKFNEIKKNGHNFSNNEDAKWRAVKILESFN